MVENHITSSLISSKIELEIITLFPQLFEAFFTQGLIGKSVERELLKYRLTQLRDFSDPPHFRVDDTPYGGGPGMLLSPGPIVKAVEQAKQNLPQARTILLSPSGSRFTQSTANELAQFSQLIFVCGRYEGLDQRAIDMVIDQQYCVGDFVVMGGEVPCMAVIESIMRLRPEVIGNSESVVRESFSSEQLLEAPQYTRPAEFKGVSVPEVLTSGDHARIAAWRANQSKLLTAKMRPDLIKGRSNA